MRRDHHKLICEKERHGSSNKFHYVRHKKNFLAASNDWEWEEIEEDDEITFRSTQRISMKRPYKIDESWKELTDFISPLQGFVRKNVGRVWNDVFSEFCAQYDQRSVLTKHLFQHLKGFVERKMVEREDGQLYSMSRYNGWRSLEEGYEQFYVDPRDGILKENPHYRSWRQTRKEYHRAAVESRKRTIRDVDNLTELQLINGTWFKVKYAYKIPYLTSCISTRPDGSTYTYSITRYNYEYDPSTPKHHSWERIQVSKTTLSKKQLRDYGIRETKYAA